MSVPYPSPEQLKEAASEIGLSLSEQDVSSYLGLIKPMVDAYNIVDHMPDELPPVKYPRTPGYFPAPEENKHNAWYVKTSIKGAADGPLKGRKVAAKDNVMVAGVPMMNGCSILEGYVPNVDAQGPKSSARCTASPTASRGVRTPERKGRYTTHTRWVTRRAGRRQAAA
jgi:amidase